MNTVPGVDLKVLRRYITARKEISQRAVRITNIAHCLNLLKHCPEDVIPVCPHVIADLGDQIDREICGIQETLDGFIYILDAEETVKSEM